ncbi:DUF4129 domain-containing protein [Nocardioides sp.]|uniref:DUF4129 domain-containing protein n=1 Tax=Nocardioides sp. TaxID=35761 RepID=UPI0035284AF9
MRGRATWTVVGVGAAVFAVVLIVGWGAAVGPRAVVRPTTPTTAPVVQDTSPSSSASPRPRDTEESSKRPADDNGLVAGFALVVVALIATAGLIAVLVGFAALSTVRHVRLGRLGPGRDGAGSEPTPPSGLDAEAVESLTRAMSLQLADLQRGSVRDAITRCWVAVEEEATHWGVGPRPTDTSTEFALRLLRGLGADPEAAQDLAELFREARYSDHEMGEDQRRRALALMTTILESARVWA